MAQRRFPVFEINSHLARRPISFVCVRFSPDFEHNLLASPCVHDPLNELIVVDNREGAHFARLGEALHKGIAKAKHDLVALVHEDALLPDGWQPRFEASLTELEAEHPDWGMVGSVGWTNQGACVGHFSDPKRRWPHNSFEDCNFANVVELDAQLIVLRKSMGILPDRDLPSIHNVGAALAHRLKKVGLESFAVNAATIHKYKDHNGSLIGKPKHSAKIADRQSLTFIADKQVSDAYYAQVYCDGGAPKFPASNLTKAQKTILNNPLILVGRGGGGTRLASTLALDCGVFLGSKLNVSGDSMEMVPSIYRSAIRAIDTRDAWSETQIVPDLRAAAANMLEAGGWPALWGFKVPETALVLPWVRAAFPRARYLTLSRDLKGMLFRRTHMTARTDNTIGRAALRAAYDYIGRQRQSIVTDSDLIRTAVSTRHQTELIKTFDQSLPNATCLRLKFEEVVADPLMSLRQLSDFLARMPDTVNIAKIVDTERAGHRSQDFCHAERELALSILDPLEARVDGLSNTLH